MKVDVIIPTHNPCTFLFEALDSCTKQTYKNYQITVIDDCSTIDLSHLIKKYPKINMLKTPHNMGPAGARNYGIARTNGDLISFLDDDDIWEPNKLLWSVELLKTRSEIGMTCGNYRILVNRRKLLPPFYKRAIKVNWNTLMRQNFVASGSVTLRRKVIEDVGGFDERFWIAEDYGLWTKISEKYKIAYIHKVLYFYSWMTNDGSSLTKRSDIQKDHEKNIEIIRKESKERMKLWKSQTS